MLTPVAYEQHHFAAINTGPLPVQQRQTPRDASLGVNTGISKSEASQIWAYLDEEVSAFRDRSLAETAYRMFPRRHLLQVRVNRRVFPGGGDRHRSNR